MKYLVIGGAGFIGSYSTQKLLKQGSSVRLLDNFSTGKRKNIEELMCQFGGHQLEVLEGDVRDVSRVKVVVRGNFHDAVRANLIASEHPNAAGKVLNVCTGLEIRLLDLLEVFRNLFPNAPQPEFAPPRAGDIYRSVGSPQKSKNIIGFRPQTLLADGLRETVEWMCTSF